jgi:hypothetical protein
MLTETPAKARVERAERRSTMKAAVFVWYAGNVLTLPAEAYDLFAHQREGVLKVAITP